MKKLLIAVLLSLSSVMGIAQTPPSGLEVLVSEGPSREFFTKVFHVSGNDTYSCFAKATVGTSTLTVSAVSNASAASFTSTHGFHANSKPLVTITGGTGAWAAVNGTNQATYVDSTHFTIPINTSSLGAVTGTLIVTTTAPRMTQPIWAVSKSSTDGTDPTAGFWAVGGFNNICDNYATLSYQ